MGFLPLDRGDGLAAGARILPVQGVKSAGKGGSSRIRVMVTRRFGDI
jgi:hypothetical protein